jgi:hypothetical protein
LLTNVGCSPAVSAKASWVIPASVRSCRTRCPKATATALSRERWRTGTAGHLTGALDRRP